MNKTKIEWVRNPDGSQGYTWNVVTGCLNGCSYCYARKLANGRLKQRYLANKKGISTINISGVFDDTIEAEVIRRQKDPFCPRFWPEKLNDIYRPKLSMAKPRGIFVCDMSDLFGIGIPEEWTQQVMDAIRANTIDRFYLLTKQPQNMLRFSPFPENCWVGVTATNNNMLIEALKHLTWVKAKIKFISFEPLLGEVGLPGWDWRLPGIDWVIIGAQTKPYKPPKLDWVLNIVMAADKANVPVFLKNNLKLNPLGYYEVNWAFRNRKLRQEMPKERI